VNLLKSKTLWLAAGTVAAGAIQAAAPFIPPQYSGLALIVVGLLTGGARTVTTQPLSEK
jgi:hypothetical protein